MTIRKKKRELWDVCACGILVTYKAISKPASGLESLGLVGERRGRAQSTQLLLAWAKKSKAGFPGVF